MSEKWLPHDMVGKPFFIYHKSMSYVHFNNNPRLKNTGDCVIRALSVITGLSWDDTYDELSEVVHDIGELPADNTTWSEYLKRLGYVKEVIPDTCPMCYKKDNPFERGGGAKVPPLFA